MIAPRRAAFAEESAEVEMLYANLEKMKTLTKKIQGSMGRLDISGRTVQDAIGPIYGSTQRLQTTNSNIDRVLAAIEKLKQPLDMGGREERIIRSRPDRVGLLEYIGSVDRTNQALRDLNTTNMRANQKAVSDLTSLLNVGTKNLLEIFCDILRQDSQRIEPAKQIMASIEFPRIPSEKTQQLRTINTHIANSTLNTVESGKLTPSGMAYVQVRGEYVTSSLKNMSLAALTTAKKVNADAIYKRGINTIGDYAQGVRGMYVAEYENICPIFSREEWGAVLAATCKDSLATFADTLKQLDQHVRSNLITDCYLAYEVIEEVSNMSFQLESKTPEFKNAFSNALKPLRETAKSSLSILLNDTKTKVQQLSALPADGSAIPITTEVMTRLQLMTQYQSPMSSIMRSLGDGGWSQQSSASNSTASIATQKPFDVGADGDKLFTHYCTDTIDTLLSGLESRAKQVMRGKSLQGVFLANNLSIIERMIRSSDLARVMQSAQSKLDAWKKKATQMYLDAWKEPSMFLLDSQVTSRAPRPPSTGQAIDSAAILKGLNNKDKDAIKEKFRNFNTSFDDLVAKHKGYRMEGEVRKSLARDVQQFIEPLYTRFWERYHEVDKGKGKYVKYDKLQLSALLASLN